MAVAFDGFSIREYTSKMRSVDVLKCWPFSTTSSSDVTRADLKSSLPPMTVPKFRWWSDELDAVRSDHDDRGKSENQPSDDEISRSESESVKSEKSAGAEEEKLEMVCPVCRVFNAATLTAVNAHIDGCLAQTMREERRHMRMMSLKSKSKVPKKRSIAEIFELEVEQPQIQTVLNFWPFNKNPDEMSITVTKFRWLSRQLEELRSNQSEGESSRNETESAKSDEGSGREEEKLEMVCPVCRAFNAATVTAVNAHIDGCLAQAMREERRHMRMNLKPKPKAPKKRSIAEILTVAPQIEVKSSELVDIDEEEENGEEEKSDGGGDSSGGGAAVISTINYKKNYMNKNKKNEKMKRSCKKKLKKKSKVEKYKLYSAVTLNNEKKTTNKKKKKKKKSFNKGLNTKKEDFSKRKVQTPVNSARKLKGTIGNERVALDDINASAHKRKASLNYVSVGKKQKAVPPIRGILKNHSTHISGNTSSGCNIQDGTEERPCDIQELTSTRHVRFSNKDDILGPKKRDSFDEIMYSLSSDGWATSLVKEQSSGSGEEAASLEVNRSGNKIAFNLDSKKEDCPIVERKQFSNTSEQITAQNFVRPCINQEKAKHLVEKSESSTKVSLGYDNSLYLFDRGNTTALHCSAYTGISRPPSALQAGNISGINTQVGDSGAYSSTGKFIDHLGNSTCQVAAMNSDANTRTFLQPSSLCSASGNQANERSLFSSQTYGDNDISGQALGYRTLSHTFSADIMHYSYPTLDWGKRAVRNNCMNENFFGLPLNSQGELINFCSSGKGRMNQFETSSISSSSSGLPVNNTAYQSSQGYLSMEGKHFVQKTLPNDCANQLPHYPARLGVTELQGSERADMVRPTTDRSFNHYVSPIDSELNLTKYPFVEQKHHDRVLNHKENGMISLKESSDLSSLSSPQPTMRLMGKDVPIGRSIKEVQVQQFEEEHVWADQRSRRSHYYEGATLENSLSKICSKQDCISGSPLQISLENMTQSVIIQSNQALQSTLLMNGPDSEFPKPFLDFQKGSPGFSKISNSYSLPITHPHPSCAVFMAPDDLPEQFISGAKPLGLGSHLQVQPASCNYSQNTRLSNGELNDRKKQPLVTKSSAFEFPFVHPTVGEHAKTSLFQSSYRNLPPWLLSSTHEKLLGASSQKFSSPSSRSFPHNELGGNFTTPVNHSAQVLNPPNPPTSHCHIKTPLGPASYVQPPLIPLGPAVCRIIDTVVLDDKTRKEDNQWENPRKRPAANLDESTKPTKLRNIEVTGLPQESSSCTYQRTTKAVEFDPCWDTARSKWCCPNDEAQNVNSISYLGFESSNLDGMVISDPVRLSPGAKHILKPSPNVDQDNSRPIHSAIPIAATTDSGRDLDIQRKMTKIYRF